MDQDTRQIDNTKYITRRIRRLNLREEATRLLDEIPNVEGKWIARCAAASLGGERSRVIVGPAESREALERACEVAGEEPVYIFHINPGGDGRSIAYGVESRTEYQL